MSDTKYHVLHKQFKDDDSPSVEGQIRWLQKQGFAEHHIQQAIVAVYNDIEQGKIPVLHTRRTRSEDGTVVIESRYYLQDDPPPGTDWESRPIRVGMELDQALLELAKRYRTDDLRAFVQNTEKFELSLRAKWQAEQNNKKSFFKRLFNR